MRPSSIVNFERVVLLSILLGIVGTWLSWARIQAMVAQTATAGGPHMSTNTVIVIQAVTIALYLLLIWFISRKASPVAKWIYVVLAGLGLVFGLFGLPQTMRYGTAPLLVAIVQYLLSITSLWLLFRPDAKAWFSEGRGPDPSTFA